MKKLLWSVILCAALALPLAAQESATWFVGKPIVGFDFVGVQAHSVQELSAVLASYKDKPFSYDLYWEMQNRLYALEYFESVQADAVASDDTKTAVIIRFTVKERATVLKIQYQGNENMSEKDLSDVVLSKVGNVYNEPLLKKDADAIVGLYRSKGFLDTTVTFEAVKNAENNSVSIIFKAAEGPKSTVRKVQFSGNTFASEGTLKGLMQTREPALFVSGDFIESKLQEDIAAIQAYYTEHGFIYALVEKVDRQIEVSEAEKRKYINLTFYIKEGTQYTFGGITFSGNKVFSSEQLSAFFRMKPGDIFNSRKFKEDMMNMSNLYYDNGYITTQIRPEEKLDEGKRQLAIAIQITEGDRSHIGRIIIQGNTKTREEVIRRELPFEEGDVFSKAKVQRGFMNLVRSGFFTQSSMIEPQPGSAEGLIDILITVEEQSTAQFEVGGTIIPGDFPLSAYANLYDKNFLGAGVTTGLNLNVTPLEQSISLYYQDDWIFGRRLTGGFNISFAHKIVQYVPMDIAGPQFGDEDDPGAYPDGFINYEAYQLAIENGTGIPSAFTMQYDSLKFSLGVVMGFGIDTELGLLGFKAEPSTTISYVTWDPTMFRPFSSQLRSELNTWQLINRLGFTVSLNAVDIPHNPTNGYFLSQYVGITGSFLFGSRHYTRTVTEAEWYWRFIDVPMGDDGRFKMVLALHSDLDMVLPPIFGEQVSVDDDLYRLDGMNVGRGWWSLTQRGAVLWNNKLEIRTPLIEEGLWWTVFFFDAVALWPEVQDMSIADPTDWFFTFGTGLRVTIPGLPLRLYFAKRFRLNETGGVEWEEGALKFWEGFNLDFVFAIDINPF